MTYLIPVTGDNDFTAIDAVVVDDDDLAYFRNLVSRPLPEDAFSVHYNEGSMPIVELYPMFDDYVAPDELVVFVEDLAPGVFTPVPDDVADLLPEQYSRYSSFISYGNYGVLHVSMKEGPEHSTGPLVLQEPALTP